MNEKSNTVPNNAFKIPEHITRLGKLYQLFSTTAAAKFALKVFSTPPNFKTPEREMMMRKSAKNISEKVPGYDKELMVYEYGFSKTKVLLLHGWSGRGTQMYAIADKLLENGMMVIAYDGFAHGQSQGNTTNMVENIKALEYIAEKYGPFEAAIGHSFGGITLLNVQSRKPIVKKAITIGIEYSTHKIFDDFVLKMGLKQKVSDKMKTIVLKKLNFNVSDFDAYKAAKNVTIPTYVIHDTQDTDVDVSAAFKIRQNLRNGLLLVTNGLGHRRILRDDRVIQKIIDFIKNE